MLAPGAGEAADAGTGPGGEFEKSRGVGSFSPEGALTVVFLSTASDGGFEKPKPPEEARVQKRLLTRGAPTAARIAMSITHVGKPGEERGSVEDTPASTKGQGVGVLNQTGSLLCPGTRAGR